MGRRRKKPDEKAEQALIRAKMFVVQRDALDEKLDEYLLQARRAGASLQTIAEEVGWNTETVRRRLMKLEAEAGGESADTEPESRTPRN